MTRCLCFVLTLVVLAVLAGEAFGASGTGHTSTGSRTKSDRPSGRKQPAASKPSSEVPTSAKEVAAASKKSEEAQNSIGENSLNSPDATSRSQASDSLSSSQPTAPPVVAADSPAPIAAFFKGDADPSTNEKSFVAAPSSPTVESPEPSAPLFDENVLRDVAAFFATLLQGFSSSDLSHLALIWVAFVITAAATRRLV